MAVFRGPEEVEVKDINIYDDPTEDVQTKTPEETPTSGLRLVGVSFALLCGLQATLNISLRLVFFTRYNSLTHERDQLQTTLNTVMKERDALQKRLCEINEGWKWFGSSCYYVSTEQRTWDESRQDCQQRGAHLVVINNMEEQEFLFNFRKYVWMGLSDSAVEGNWTWVDGTPLTTAYWAKGEPDNGTSGEEQDCAAILSYSTVDLVNSWYDYGCGVRLYWICERGI